MCHCFKIDQVSSIESSATNYRAIPIAWLKAMVNNLYDLFTVCEHCSTWNLYNSLLWICFNPYLNGGGGVVATPKFLFSFLLFPPFLNALLYPKMTLGYCFPILSAHYSEIKNTHHPLRGRVVVQKVVYRRVWCNPPYTKSNK